MHSKTCQNPECKKTYAVEHPENDDGFCSFPCWENVNCQKPIKAQIEEIFSID